MTFGIARSRTNDDSSTVSVVNTSPKISKSDTPAARAVARILGAQRSKNARSTCFAVSTRKPSTLNWRIHSPNTSASPFTTNGCSVKMSSSPKKSPCSKQAGEQLSNVMFPRLWYRVTSFSQAGFLRLAVLREDERLARLVAAREAGKTVGAGVAQRRERLALAVAVRHLVRATEGRARRRG